jgi:hypothetical protein
MAVFGLLVGASCVLLIHLRLALLLLSCLGPSHRVRRRDMRGISFDIGMYGEDMMFGCVMTFAATWVKKFGCAAGMRRCQRGGAWGGTGSLGHNL